MADLTCPCCGTWPCADTPTALGDALVEQVLRSRAPAPRRILAFTGTRLDFLRYLADWWVTPDGGFALLPDEDFEWELTATIARHPAGKGLRSGDCGCLRRPNHVGECAWTDLPRCPVDPSPGACMDGHQTAVPCSGELGCP